MLLRIAIATGFSACLVGCVGSLPETSGVLPLVPVGSSSNAQTLPTSQPSPSPLSIQAANSTLQPTVTINYRYYSVGGSTAREIRSQLNQTSPVVDNGRRFDANTHWYVRWFYYYNSNGNSCRITQVSGSVEVLFTLPQWQKPANAPRSLANKWQRYMTALKIHEDGHKDHGIAAAQEILPAIQNLPAYPSCPELETAANAMGNTIIQRYNQKDIEYDRVTQHGATQGAIFP